jgi:hypothetical protein
VKLLKADPNQLVFQLAPVEKAALLEVLKRYPCVPPAHHRLTRREATDPDAEKQRLLDEALAEQRAANQRQLRALLQHPETFRRVESHWQFTLRHGEFEWLLQVLNDVRVGSWLALGSPEELPRSLPDDPQTAPHAVMMELAGLFQMTLLEAIEHGSGI